MTCSVSEIIGVVLLSTAALTAHSQTPPAQQPAANPAATPVQSISGSLGLLVYPAKGQAAKQQSVDEQECYNWAKTQTGIDPAAPAPVQMIEDLDRSAAARRAGYRRELGDRADSFPQRAAGAQDSCSASAICTARLRTIPMHATRSQPPAPCAPKAAAGRQLAHTAASITTARRRTHHSKTHSGSHSAALGQGANTLPETVADAVPTTAVLFNHVVKSGGQAKQDTKIRILDAADAIFVRRGVEGTRMQEVADRAGVL